MFGTLIYAMLYAFLNAARLVGWFRWRVSGRENLPPREEGGMVIVMNHINWIDIPIIGALLPWAYRLSWLAKAELFQRPLAGWFFRQMNVIPIRRGRRDLAAMDAVVDALRAGAVLLIFPEGTRSRDGELQPGRGGAIRMAMDAGVPIVPIAIIGSERGLRGTLTRHPVTVTIGKPYRLTPTADGRIPPDLMDQLTTDMMRHIAALLPPERRGAYAAQLEAPREEAAG